LFVISPSNELVSSLLSGELFFYNYERTAANKHTQITLILNRKNSSNSQKTQFPQYKQTQTVTTISAILEFLTSTF